MFLIVFCISTFVFMRKLFFENYFTVLYFQGKFYMIRDVLYDYAAAVDAFLLDIDVESSLYEDIVSVLRFVFKLPPSVLRRLEGFGYNSSENFYNNIFRFKVNSVSYLRSRANDFSYFFLKKYVYTINHKRLAINYLVFSF